MKLATIDVLAEAAAARRPVAFAKRLSDAAEFVLPDAAAPAALNEAGSAEFWRRTNPPPSRSAPKTGSSSRATRRPG